MSEEEERWLERAVLDAESKIADAIIKAALAEMKPVLFGTAPLIQAAVEAEREACAKIAEAAVDADQEYGWVDCSCGDCRAKHIAAKIRERK